MAQNFLGSEYGTILLGVTCFYLFQLALKVYRWKYQVLKGIDGPSSPSFLLGNEYQTLTSPVGTLWNKWEERYNHLPDINIPHVNPFFEDTVMFIEPRPGSMSVRSLTLD